MEIYLVGTLVISLEGRSRDQEYHDQGWLDNWISDPIDKRWLKTVVVRLPGPVLVVSIQRGILNTVSLEGQRQPMLLLG